MRQILSKYNRAGKDTFSKCSTTDHWMKSLCNYYRTSRVRCSESKTIKSILTDMVNSLSYVNCNPILAGLPAEGVFIAGQNLTCDGFAPAVLSALMCAAAIEGPMHWLEVVPMLGGLAATINKLVFKN